VCNLAQNGGFARYRSVYPLHKGMCREPCKLTDLIVYPLHEGMVRLMPKGQDRMVYVYPSHGGDESQLL
jgi:hypothetical protein